MPEQKQEKQISAAAIKYLIAMGGLCGKDGKIRSVDIAEKMGVSKPSAYSMIKCLCAAGLAKKERYGAVYLTDDGKTAALRYGESFERLCRKMQDTFGLEREACKNAVCEILADSFDLEKA